MDKTRKERRREYQLETIKTVTAIIVLINSILTLIILLVK